MALVLAFVTGRYTARPVEVLEEERVTEEITASSTAESTSSTEARQELATVEERVVGRREIVYRDGPVASVTEEVEASSSAAQAITEARQEEAKLEIVEVFVDREVERRVDVKAPRPDWRVGGLVGIDLGGLSPTYGAQLERRIIGPVYVGAWGLSSGQGGISVGVEWR